MRWVPLGIILILGFINSLVITHKNLAKKQLYFRLISVNYLMILAAIVFTPVSINGLTVLITPKGIGHVNLTQLVLNNVGYYENILLTLPLGILMKINWPKKSVITVTFLGMLISIGIETIQYFLSHWLLIDRTSDINDVLANTTGVLLGTIVVAGYQYFRKQKTDS